MPILGTLQKKNFFSWLVDTPTDTKRLILKYPSKIALDRISSHEFSSFTVIPLPDWYPLVISYSLLQ